MDDMQRYLVEEELEHYRDGWISRREFIHLATLVGLGAGPAALMAARIAPAPARAAPPMQLSPFSVPEGDPSVGTDWISFTADDGVQLRAYLAWPAPLPTDASHPAVAIWNRNRNLDPHAQDVARRFGKEGYVAIAPDLPSRTGSPSSEMTQDQARAAFASLSRDRMARDMAAALDFLTGHPAVDETKLAAIGFCAGGEIVWTLATLYPKLRAAAPFYGSNPPLSEVPNIRAAVFAAYGELDTRLNAGIPAIQAAMEATGTKYKIKIYPNSQHAFFDDSDPRSVNIEAASEAWFDVLKWFSEQMDLPTAWM